MQLIMQPITSGAQHTNILPKTARIITKVPARASNCRRAHRGSRLVVCAEGKNGTNDTVDPARKEELIQDLRGDQSPVESALPAVQSAARISCSEKRIGGFRRCACRSHQHVCNAGLKRGGVDKETATRILKVWEETGAKSPDQLQKLLVGRSLRAAGLVSFQTLLDAGASFGGFTTGFNVAAGQPFLGKIVVEYLGYFLGLYFGTSVLLDLFTLGSIAVAAVQYSTNSEAFLAAVREIAGPKESGINVIRKAQQAVNTAKVFSALNRISAILRERGGEQLSSDDSLGNLSVFLLLQRAEETGFKPEDYNLSSNQAATIAAVFSKYDLNDDFVLSVSEVDRLFAQEGYNFSEEEVKQAIALLDKNNDNLIQFSEFVDWWQNEVPEEAKTKLEKVEASKAGKAGVPE